MMFFKLASIFMLVAIATATAKEMLLIKPDPFTGIKKKCCPESGCGH
jgi:hypothetical protein